MIKYITSIGKYMNVVGGPSTNYINNYGGAQGLGNMRFNTGNQNIEVYDGNSWMTLNMGHATVGLSTRAEELLDWAEKKRQEELELQALVETNTTISDLVNQIKEKQEQIRIVKTLIKEEEKI